MMIRARALYVCYFGLRQPLVQTQVLPYLRELVAGGIGMSLLTFEPEIRKSWDADSIAEWRRRLRDDGIEWHLLPYHKWPSLPATPYDVFAGAWKAAAIARREKIDILHGRSHVGAAIGALAKRVSGGRLIFDIRGFLAEEYVDSGNWSARGLPYRLTKMAERWLYRAADGFVVLTERARQTLFPDGAGRPLEVIPCCVDAARFAQTRGVAGRGSAVGEKDFEPGFSDTQLPTTGSLLHRDAIRQELGLAGRLVFVYAGALGGYYLTRENAGMMAAARAQDLRVYALVLTQSSPDEMLAELQRLGFGSDDYRVITIAPDDVPKYLCAADVALSLIRPSYARRSMSPTKFAEYLAAGLPVIATAGIGDLDQHIEESRTGVLLQRLDDEAYVAAFRAVEELRNDPDLADRCRREAHARYDLHDVGGTRYLKLYDAVLSA